MMPDAKPATPEQIAQNGHIAATIRAVMKQRGWKMPDLNEALGKPRGDAGIFQWVSRNRGAVAARPRLAIEGARYPRDGTDAALPGGAVASGRDRVGSGEARAGPRRRRAIVRGLGGRCGADQARCRLAARDGNAASPHAARRRDRVR